jgi:hypothetical protein
MQAQKDRADVMAVGGPSGHLVDLDLKSQNVQQYEPRSDAGLFPFFRHVALYKNALSKTRSKLHAGELCHLRCDEAVDEWADGFELTDRKEALRRRLRAGLNPQNELAYAMTL